MSDDIPLSQLARYFAGECSSEELVALERWIAADPARQSLVAELRAAWDRAIQPEPVVDIERAWEAVTHRKVVRTLSPNSRQLFVHVGTPSRRKAWWFGAAGVAAASIAAWLAVRPEPPAQLPTHGPPRTVATRPGQWAEIYLSDGTRVRLGAHSTLRFPTTFGADRRVFLDGEAYFDVVQGDVRPFAVRTASALARDLGTRFVMFADRGSATEVIVEHGAVVLATAGDSRGSLPATDSLVLSEADLGRLDLDGRLTLARGVDVTAYLAWMDGRLVFNDTPLSQALPRLTRWYGIAFMISDPALGSIRLTANFDGTSLEDAKRQLAAILDLEIEQHDGTLWLRPKQRGP